MQVLEFEAGSVFQFLNEVRVPMQPAIERFQGIPPISPIGRIETVARAGKAALLCPGFLRNMPKADRTPGEVR